MAIVGCGMSPVGAGLGSEIDSHDLVIRANRAFDTAGKEQDWGRRTDILCIGNMAAMRRWIPTHAPFVVIEVEAAWGGIWKHSRKPLAGTFAALHAERIGASEITLYGIDLYHDALGIVRGPGPTVFRRHSGLPPNWRWTPDLDRDAILGIKCHVEWRLRRS